jgi:hypothetical protein
MLQVNRFRRHRRLSLMPVLDTLRPSRGDAGAPDAVPVSLGSRRHRALLLVIVTVLLAGVLALVFGPGRGLRTDIALVSDDLDASRDGIFLTLDTGRQTLEGVRQQLQLTENSLVVQEQGLEVAVASQRIAETTAEDTEAILDQTTSTLQTVREVTAAMGPLGELDGKIEGVVMSVEAGIRLARSTLTIAEQTLATGQQALVVARDTLATLKRSEQIQLDLLDVARKTLQQAEEINRKIPGAPIFPTPPTTP